MATHSSVLAWRIPGTAEPGGLPSMGTRLKGFNSNSNNDVLGVGFLLGGSPLKVSRGQLCFPATAFPKLWAQKPAVNSTDSTLDISYPSLSHTGKGQCCSSLLPIPIWLFMVNWMRGGACFVNECALQENVDVSCSFSLFLVLHVSKK